MAMVASSGQLSGGEFFVKGWKGDEAEEVDICSSEDEGSFGFENEEGVGEVGGEIGFPQQLGKRKWAVSPSGSSISRDTGPCSPKRLSARAYRKAFYMDDTNPGPSKGKEQATDEGTSNRRNQQSQGQRDVKRKKVAAEELSLGPSFRDLSPENLCTWNTQWVCCCRCKKWRRIPYDVDVEIATWECKDNGWSAIHASCDYPQDVVLRRLNETIDHACALSVDLSAHVTGSSLDEQLDSDDSYKRVANKTGVKPSESETAAMEIEKPEADLSGQTSKVPEEHRCQKCGLEGQIISCSLCQSGYHVNCLDPPLIDSVAQGWHCESCSNRTGVESVYMCTNKESYYVKWKGRSHVHNSILTEAELAKLAPKKLAYLKKRHRVGKALKWDPIWAEPQRFIAKREAESRQTEWYVKWRGLGYEQCTWEPADSGICASENGLLLALRYERWCEAASSPSAQGSELCGKLDKLSRRPDWMKNEKMEQHQLEMLNKLRDCWFNRKEGIVLCKLNQEHMIPILAFTVWLCRVSCVNQPILMVMPSEMLHLWDKKLGELQPELNSVVFHGSPEARQLIQQYEFDLIKGRSKCNIVISTFESVISALDLLNSLAWSALLVDESHVKAGKSFFRSIGLLRTDFRLIFSTLFEPCKNNVQELLQMLALFDKGGCEDDTMQLADVIEKLREHVVCDHKVKSSNCKEFWVPVQMSPVQIHRYCETLVEHYELLRSGNMSQGDAHLQNIIQLLQSCCCHPYIGTEKMIKSVEEVALPEDYLRLGIKASGKLDLLHRLLLQYHTDKKTILILVQPNSMELKNILDDYLRQQFGSGSYVRIERRMDAKCRQSALRELNDKDSGCFALLLDRNATVQYQLRDVDAVFVYESDWNPWNDTSYIQSLGIGNKYRMYRLYICHSIEEKILLYARQGLNLSTLRNVNARRFQEILQWGAKLLFELDEWNLKSGASTDARIGWEGVIEDMTISLRKHLVFLNDAEVKQLATTNSEPTMCSEKLKNILSPREPSEEGIPLYGVPTNVVLDGSSSAESFWSFLLKDKHAELMQLNEPKKLRKREHATENESKKKAKIQQQKVARGDTVVHNLSPGVCSAEEENSPNNVAEEPIQDGGLEKATSMHSQDLEPASSAKSMREEQQELVDTSKPELKFICESLKMPANVLGRAEELLDFAANNLRMSRDYLRELELSLCWIAAEQLDVNFDLSGAASVVSTTYNTTVDEGAVAAVRLKLKDQLFVSLPQLFKGAARFSEEVPRSPERVTSDSSQEVLPGRVQTEIDAAVLERTKTDLLRLRSQRRMKLLDYQKAEWCRLIASKEAEIEKAKQLCNMECRIIELSDETQYQKFQKISGRKLKLEARLKAIEDRHSRERQTLLLRQRSCRELESCVIASHLDQLQNGFLPGPLPELILPEVSDRVTEDLVSWSEQERVPSSQVQEVERISPRRQVTHMGTEQQSQADPCEKSSSSKNQQEERQVKLLGALTPCGKSREGQLSHPEQEQMNGQVPQDRNGVQESVEETDREVAARREHDEEPPTRQEVDSESSEPQSGVNERRPMADQQQQPQTASAVSMPHFQLNGPQRQDLQSQVREPTAAQSTQTRSLSVAVSGAQSQTQVYAPAIVSTEARSQTDRSQLLQTPASQQTQSGIQDRPVSLTQVGRQLAPQRQISRNQTHTQDSAAGIQRQAQPASTQAQSMGQTQAQHLVGSQVPPLLRAQSQMLPASSTVAQSQVAAGTIRQVAVQDPLSNEEAKLIKERERTKKLYNEEVARIQLQYQQAMETLQRNFRQRDESFGTNLQKASEQRRLADALRKRDRLGIAFPRRQAGSSADYIPQLNPLTAFQNSIPAFQAPTSFQGSNQVPVQLPTNISPGSQPVLPFLVAGTRPANPCFLSVHQGRVEHTRPDSGGQSRLERDQVLTPATARSEQQQSSLQFATQRLFGATVQSGLQQTPGARNDSASAHFRQQQQQQQQQQQLRMNQGSPGTEQLNLQLRLQQQQQPPPRTEHVSPHLRSTTGVDAIGNEQVSSLSRLNHHFRAAPTGTLEQATAQLRLQHMTEQGGQHFRQATGSDCTGTEQFRLQQQARIEQASQQLRTAEQHLRVSEGRGTEQASSQLGIQQQQVRVSRTGEWPQLYGTSPVAQTRVGGEQQLPSPQFHQMLQQQWRAPPWNPPQAAMMRTAPVNTPINNSVSHNIIIQNNNIVSSNVNSGAVTQTQANELRASSQNMYTSIGRQLQLGTASMLGLDPRFLPVRPVQQQQQQQQQFQQQQLQHQLQHQRLPHQQHVQLPLDGPAVMSERDYIYLSDDE